MQPSNADSIVLQWAHVHGLDPKPSRADEVDGYPHRVWLDAAGKPVIEQYLITGMAHGTPLNPGTGEGESGEAGAHMLDANISSTDRIAAFWGITEPAAEKARPAKSRRVDAPNLPAIPTLQPQPQPRAARSRARPLPAAASSIQKTIEDALKAAGLMGR